MSSYFTLDSISCNLNKINSLQLHHNIIPCSVGTVWNILTFVEKCIVLRQMYYNDIICTNTLHTLFVQMTLFIHFLFWHSVVVLNRDSGCVAVSYVYLGCDSGAGCIGHTEDYWWRLRHRQSHHVNHLGLCCGGKRPVSRLGSLSGLALIWKVSRDQERF